jgi:hypothetical protein
MHYCKSFSKNIGHEFTKSTIRVSALTGSAAVDIGGDTTARQFGLRNKSDSVQPADIELYKDTRLNIVDEVSFACFDKDLTKLSQNLQSFTECTNEAYGNIAIVFIGDFCQLAPVMGVEIYTKERAYVWEQCLNSLVELKGTHRYRDCPILAKAMPELRDGEAAEMRRLLKTRLVTTGGLQIPTEGKVQYATWTNKKKASINARIFEKHLMAHHSECPADAIPTNAIVIVSSAKWSTTRTKLSHAQHKRFLETCSEGQICNASQKRVAPLLCLIQGGDAMVTDNLEVSTGVGNGTCCTFAKAILKCGETTTPIQVHGRWIHSVDIDQVHRLVMRWNDESRYRGTFEIKSVTSCFKVQYPDDDDYLGIGMKWAPSMRIEHFPMSVNFATTGHKLQGKSVDILVIAEWTSTHNWPYVVLSRVRTLDGLFLLEPMPDHLDFAPDPRYVSMMERLRETILDEPISMVQDELR